jgi:hypothetical protein
MAKDDGAGAGNILLAFILGAVSGAAVALLYAPASGRETRDYLGERAREGRERRGGSEGPRTEPGPGNAVHGHRSRARSVLAKDAGERVNWSIVFLGIIAVAAARPGQIFVLISAGRIARRPDRLADQIDVTSPPARQPERNRAMPRGSRAAQVERMTASSAMSLSEWK